jgi:hypothetical protein
VIDEGAWFFRFTNLVKREKKVTRMDKRKDGVERYWKNVVAPRVRGGYFGQKRERTRRMRPISDLYGIQKEE